MASSRGTVYVLIIVGKGDVPIFEADLSSPGKRDDTPHLDQFIIHQALDIVDELVWQSNSMYLKNVDSFNNFHVSAFCSAGHIKFMLLHKHKSDEGTSSGMSASVETGIRMFLQEIHEHYVKYLMNPLYEVNGLITSPSFDQKVRFSARKHLVYGH